MELLISASLIAAFVAGMAALFAPCCITVLLPAYFASIFRERRKVFLMTFIFFLGILAVFLPLGLGAGFLGKIFGRFHNQIFGVGGVFLIILGTMLLIGKKFSLPFKSNPYLKNRSAFSVFFLGIFSGIATTCCAPVLAGVLALSTLAGSVFWGGIYTLSYVLGMVSPLFLISLFLDKIDFAKKLAFSNKPITYRLTRKKITVALSEIISGTVFLLMGILIFYLAVSNRLFSHSSYQTNINIYLTKFLDFLNNFVKFIPEYIWAILAIFLVIIITKRSIKQFKEENYENK